MILQLKFGDMVHILSKLHDVAESKRTALRSRLQAMQKEGFPSGLNPGKGVKFSYTLNHLFKLVFAFEFLRMGITPKRSIELVEANWDTLEATVGKLHNAWRQGAIFESYVWVVNIDGLSDLRNSSSSRPPRLWHVSLPTLASLRDFDEDTPDRLMGFNFGRIADLVFDELEELQRSGRGQISDNFPKSQGGTRDEHS